MNQERETFIKAIQAEPDDDTPRLIFADWLEEQGDSQSELIRLQCELANEPLRTPRLKLNEIRERLVTPKGKNRRKRLREKRDREKELLAEFYPKHVQPIKDIGGGILEVRRGFLDEVRIETQTFIDQADFVLDTAPALRVLNLRKIGKRIHELLETPGLEQIRFLDLRITGLTDNDIIAMASSTRLKDLAGLDLHSNGITARGVQVIANSPNFRNLRWLDISSNRLPRAVTHRIIDSPMQLDELISD